jgi:hypothetical protein
MGNRRAAEKIYVAHLFRAFRVPDDVAETGEASSWAFAFQ